MAVMLSVGIYLSLETAINLSMEKSKGKLVRWLDNKGFGFIKPENGKGDIFIHISALKGMRRKPIVGDVIHFEIRLDANGKTRAVNARIEGVEQVLTLERLRHKRKKDHSAPLKKRSYRKSVTVKKPLKSYKLISVLIAVFIGFALNTFQNNAVNFIPSDEQKSIDSGDSQQLTRAFENQPSDIQVRGMGIVIRTLSDDTQGSQHQRFIVKLASGKTLLIAHNIDLAPRINSLREGDSIEFYGEYEWNSKGGVLHWTHHDPRGNHENGWLKHDGSTYQ